MGCEEVFEAISHPLRVEILKKLAERPMRFSELKRELGVGSSGRLDYHLKKLEGLIAVDGEGRYCLTRDGYAALQAIEAIGRYGWQKRAYVLNLIAYVVANAYGALSNLGLWLWTVLPLSTAWLAFYTYWMARKRRALRW
ncbi:MAG: winged helix-turn-helix transcriptional regulator [Thermoproteales archaeon]|nr:winged helix-turn-helix transcriptional regulator [Thermoproteales archaeon]